MAGSHAVIAVEMPVQGGITAPAGTAAATRNHWHHQAVAVGAWPVAATGCS